jgi:WD40 repeat protein/tRNA A-37 threonylcarbamoyl transferase component Bud32
VAKPVGLDSGDGIGPEVTAALQAVVASEGFGEPLPAALARSVDQACNRFEAAWKARQRPRLEEYAGLPQDPDFLPLVRELILLDLYYRRRAGDIPAASDYLGRFPSLEARWLEDAVHPPTTTGNVLDPASRATPFRSGDQDAPTPILSETAGPAAGLAVARRFGDYELQQELGRGAMGVVYKARQLSLQRTVALKVLLAKAAAYSEGTARFAAEAIAVARLQHPHIVQLFEAGEHDGCRYLALEYVPGKTLASRLRAGPVLPAAAARLLEPLARAVHYAHLQGVVHRDLKPSNILLSADGVPKVTDFGLAKLLDSEAGNVLTQSGAVVGTPSYMAPEQAGGRSKEVGPATDVYALGVVLYEMLTSRPPFQSATPLDTLAQLVTVEPVPPSRMNSGVPRDLETVCLKCLQKEPRRRYPSALDIADDLCRFLAGRPISARPVGRGERLLLWARRRPALAAIHGLLLVIVTLGGLVGGAVVLWQRAEEAWNREALAKKEAEDALREKAAAQEALDQVLYLRNVDLASREWPEGGVARARQLLQLCPPRLRQWEWHYLDRLSHSELLTLPASPPGASNLAYNPDGTCLAGACGSGGVLVWDAQTGREMRSLRGPAGNVEAVAFSPDGARLATGWGQDVRIWDIKSGKQLLVLQGHRDRVLGVAFSPDGQRLASASWDGTVRVWDAPSGHESFTLCGRSREGNGGFIAAVTFSPDSKRLAGTGSDRVYVWDADSRREVLTFEGTRGAFSGVAFSPDGTRLAAAGQEQDVSVWDARTGQKVLALSGHTATVWGVTFSPDGTRLATASADNTVRVWHAATGAEVFCLRGHQDAVHSVVFSPDGTRLASGSRDRTVRFWDAVTGPGPLAFRAHTDMVLALAFSPDSTRLGTGDWDGNLRIWDARTGQERLTFHGHTGTVGKIAFDPSGARLASSGADQMVRVWDAATGKELLTLRGHTKALHGVAFSPDGSRLASASHDGMVRVWDARTGSEVFNFRGHKGPAYSVAFNPDASCLASAGQDEKVRVWDLGTGRERLVLDGHKGGVVSVVFSPDGLRLASGGIDCSVRLWDAATGQELRILEGHRHVVNAVAFSPDGQRLTSTARDGTVRLWDTKSGQQALTLKAGPEGGVGGAVAFSPDGLRLAATCADGTIRIWDASPPPE